MEEQNLCECKFDRIIFTELFPFTQITSGSILASFSDEFCKFLFTILQPNLLVITIIISHNSRISDNNNNNNYDSDNK